MGDRRTFDPPLPEDVSEQAFGTAWFWSRRFGVATDRGSLVALARLIPPGFTGHRPQDLAWKRAVSQGRLPRHRIVKSFVFFARAQERRRRQQAAAAVLAAHLDLDRLGPEVADWVAGYLETIGSGPLWREVGAAFGWNHIHAHAILTALRRAGWVSYTQHTRSLRPARPQACPRRPQPAAGATRGACLRREPSRRQQHAQADHAGRHGRT
jgi:hypothetical protein